jgi:hypothetical protein
MKRSMLVSILSLAFLLQYLSPGYASIRPGERCPKVGVTQKVGSFTFTCQKFGKNYFWDNGVRTSPIPNPTPGTSCEFAGDVKSYQAKDYTCLKLGKKLIWDNGVPQYVEPMCKSLVGTNQLVASFSHGQGGWQLLAVLCTQPIPNDFNGVRYQYFIELRDGKVVDLTGLCGNIDSYNRGWSTSASAPLRMDTQTQQYGPGCLMGTSSKFDGLDFIYVVAKYAGKTFTSGKFPIGP